MQTLRLDAAALSARTGLSEGYLSRIMAGERGKSELPKLHEKVQTAFGVPGHFWTAASDADAEKALRSRSQHGGEQMGMMIGPQAFGGAVDYRVRLAELATERDESGEIVKALMRTKAPDDADAVWWFRRYLELRDEHGGK